MQNFRKQWLLNQQFGRRMEAFPNLGAHRHLDIALASMAEMQNM